MAYRRYGYRTSRPSYGRRYGYRPARRVGYYAPRRARRSFYY